MIELKGVVASYRSGFTRRRLEVLKGVSFSVPRGAIAGYLGVNGAGKTTTIKLMVGINMPDAGAISIDGRDPRGRAARAGVGYLPENPYFYEYLTPREALDFYARLSGVSRDERAKRIGALLDEVDLAAAADRPVGEFSKGMRQRLGLAQALIHEPAALVLDEPLTGLDPMGRLALRDMIARQRARARTVFFSSHVLSDMEAVCDHLVILDAGKIAYEGPVQKLLEADGDAPVRIAFSAVDDEKRAKLATDLGATIEARGTHLEVVVPGASGERALDLVRAAGGKIASYQPKGLSLEEWFLKTYGAKRAGGGAS
jgi:ABC-2 type transport system ATP-binding protein